MRLEIKNNKIVAYAETESDSLSLITLAHKKTGDGSVQPKRRKKHNHVKQCHLCGKGYKGNAGLGVHVAKAHPVPVSY